MWTFCQIQPFTDYPNSLSNTKNKYKTFRSLSNANGWLVDKKAKFGQLCELKINWEFVCHTLNPF